GGSATRSRPVRAPRSSAQRMAKFAHHAKVVPPLNAAGTPPARRPYQRSAPGLSENSISLADEVIVTAADFENGPAFFVTGRLHAGRPGRRCAAFENSLEAGSGDINRRRRVRRNFDLPVEPAAFAAPIACDDTVRGTVKGFDKAHVAARLRIHDDVFEAGLVRVGLDAGE